MQMSEWICGWWRMMMTDVAKYLLHIFTVIAFWYVWLEKSYFHMFFYLHILYHNYRRGWTLSSLTKVTYHNHVKRNEMLGHARSLLDQQAPLVTPKQRTICYYIFWCGIKELVDTITASMKQHVLLLYLTMKLMQIVFPLFFGWRQFLCTFTSFYVFYWLATNDQLMCIIPTCAWWSSPLSQLMLQGHWLKKYLISIPFITRRLFSIIPSMIFLSMPAIHMYSSY